MNFFTVTETVKELITICTAADPLPELAEFVDLDVLPPCINPEGHGEAWPEFGPIVWDGGPLPPPSSSGINSNNASLRGMANSSPKSNHSTTTTTTSSTSSQQTKISKSVKSVGRKSSKQLFSPKSVVSLGVGEF